MDDKQVDKLMIINDALAFFIFCRISNVEVSKELDEDNIKSIQPIEIIQNPQFVPGA